MFLRRKSADNAAISADKTAVPADKTAVSADKPDVPADTFFNADERRILAECIQRMRTNPAEEHGPAYSHREWFGPIPDAERKRMRRAIKRLAGRGLLVAFTSKDDAEHLKLTDDGVAAASLFAPPVSVEPAKEGPADDQPQRKKRRKFGMPDAVPQAGGCGNCGCRDIRIGRNEFTGRPVRVCRHCRQERHAYPTVRKREPRGQ